MTFSSATSEVNTNPKVWQLKDICSKIGSGATPRGGESAYLDERVEYAFVRSQNVFDFKFESSEVRFISGESAQKLKGVHLQKDDILLNITGDGVTFSRCCIVDERILPAAVNQHVAIIRVNQEVCLPGYLLAFLCAPETKAYIASFNAGGSRRAITKGHIESFEIPAASLKQQEAIQNIVYSIIQKIELNRETNQTLEQMAQAMFKSWFVDFDPTKAKMSGEQPEGMDAATASLFPEKLVESELGELPEGWKLVPVGKLLANAIGGDWGKEAPDEKHTEEVRIVRGTDIPKLHGGAINSVPVRYVESKKLKTRKLERGDIVIEVSGGSKDQPTGRSLFISDNILKRLVLPSEPASFCRRFKPESYEIGLLLAIHFQLMYQAGKTWEYQNQSTGISNFQTKYFLEAEYVVIPSDEVLEAFIKQVSPMMDMIHSNQNIELAKLRDTLLPKLLSGEIELGIE